MFIKNKDGKEQVILESFHRTDKSQHKSSQVIAPRPDMLIFAKINLKRSSLKQSVKHFLIIHSCHDSQKTM